MMMNTMLNGMFKLLSEDMSNNRCLSKTDIARLNGLEAIYVSNQGKLLALSYEDHTLALIEWIVSGYVPENAMFAAPYTYPLDIRRKGSGEIVPERMALEAMKTSFIDRIGGHGIRPNIFSMYTNTGMFSTLSSFIDAVSQEECGRTEASKELSHYLWPLDQDAIQIQFRSPVPSLPPRGQLKAVFNNSEGSSGGDFCLATCDDGTVQWLPESECGNGAHVWTVHLFDRPSGEQVDLSQKLQRRVPIALNNNYVNVINNNNFGGNRNDSGTQNIGSINARTVLNILLQKQNPEQRE